MSENQNRHLIFAGREAETATPPHSTAADNNQPERCSEQILRLLRECKAESFLTADEEDRLCNIIVLGPTLAQQNLHMFWRVYKDDKSMFVRQARKLLVNA